MLKLDPKNTELLKQKQDILNSSIATTEDKLKQLKQIKDEADKKMAEGTKINEENYRALQREIINTQNKLSDLKNEASNWTKAGKKIEEIGTKIEGIGNKVDSLGNKLSTRVTAPLVALGVVGVKSAAEQEAAMQQVNLIYGEAADTIKQFAENTAMAYNMSSKDAYKYSQVYGNLIQSITNDEKENAQYTQELLKASSVIASATGRTMEDVMDRIRSGLLGNTEAIEDLGVNVNVALLETTDAFKKFAGNKSWNKLDFQTQQQIRLFGILEQTTKKYGKEVNKNTSSNIQKLTAKFENMTSKLSKNLLPIANKLIDKADKFIDKIGNLNDEEAENIIKIGLMVVAAGPLVKILGTTTSTIGGVAKGIGTFSQAISLAKNGIVDATGSAAILAKVFQGLTSPIGLAATGIAAAVSLIVIAVNNMQKDAKEAFGNMGNAANDFYQGIQNAEGYLSSFNSTLFASSKEQENLTKQMDEIQAGITKICKTASDERRGYTQEEVTQLDEYFEKLRKLKDREIQIQNQIAGAITQQAKTTAEVFNGSLEEYKIQAQEWIATAQKQADSTIDLIENATIEEVALLNQRYGTEANMQNEAYAKEYSKIIEQKQAKIDAANSEIAQIYSVYAEGYAKRGNAENDFIGVLKTYTSKQEDLLQKHNEKIQQIKDGELWYVTNTFQAIESENSTFGFNQQEIWNEMYKNMTEEQEKELGVWLAMLAQTEMYGGKIDDETKKIVDSILNSYDTMPSGTKKVMKETMSGMLEGMKDKEPSLFAKATSIANGILGRLKTAFDIHSPSKETRSIFENVMKGAELGLADEERNLNNQVNEIANKMKGSFSSINPNMGAIKQSVIDQTKTVFTTPQIVFNVQELDEAKLNQCFNYINRKFGSQY